MTVDNEDRQATARIAGQRSPWWIIPALVFCNLVVFSQALTYEFLMWDDEKFVVRHIERLGGLSTATATWAMTNNENGWRTPLPYLSLFADASLFGLNPAGYHLTNMLIHTATTVLLFIALRWMTARPWVSAAAAALFAVHPLHVEPVVWVTGRWELLCGFFWIAGMLAYAWYARRPTAARLLAVILTYLCALASKPMALTFPFALLLLDYWPLYRISPFQKRQADNNATDAQAGISWPEISWQRAVGEKLPLFAVMVAALLISYQSKAGYVSSKALVRFTPGQRALNALESYATYVRQFAWPDDLAFYYPHPVIAGGFGTAQLLGATALLVGITVATVILARRQRFLLVGWLWFLGVLVPSIGLVQVEHHAHADRYMYIPLIGLILLTCWGMALLFERLPRAKACASIAVIGCLLVFTGVARQQASHWRSSRTLFEHAISVDAGNFKAWTGLGELAMREGEHAVAEECFRNADRAFHARGLHLYLVGRAAFAQGKYPQAIDALEASLRQNPALTRARGLLAESHAARDNAGAARREYDRMVQLTPRDPSAHKWFADYLTRTGDYDTALLHYRMALELDPLNQRVPKLIGTALSKLGRADEAVAFYKQYLRKYPRRVEIADDLAWILSTHEDEAVRDGETAVEIAEQLCAGSQFSNRFMLDTLSAAYAEVGRYKDAADAAMKSLGLARVANDQEHSAVLEARLLLFRNRRPYRQTRSSATIAVAGSRDAVKQEALQ